MAGIERLESNTNGLLIQSQSYKDYQDFTIEVNGNVVLSRRGQEVTDAIDDDYALAVFNPCTNQPYSFVKLTRADAAGGDITVTLGDPPSGVSELTHTLILQVDNNDTNNTIAVTATNLLGTAPSAGAASSDLTYACHWVGGTTKKWAIITA